MRILITTPVDPLHAAHNRIHEFIRALSAHHDVDVVSTFAWWLQDRGTHLYGPDYGRGVLTEAVGRAKIRYLSQRETSPVVQELISVANCQGLLGSLDAESYDLLLNYNSVLSGLAFSRIMKATPMLTDLADDVASMVAKSWAVPGLLRPLAYAFSRYTISQAVERSRAVLVATPKLAERYSVPKEKANLLPNGVDTQMFRRVESSLAKKQFGLEGRNVIGYVGVLRDWVDIDLLVFTMERLRDAPEAPCLLVVGSEGGLDHLRRLSADRGLQDAIVTIGTIPYAEVPLAISAMDIGLIPFKLNAITRNALPMKLFEYMACEIPVVSQRLDAIQEAVGNRVLYASSPAEFAKAITHLFATDSIRTQLGIAGRDFVESQRTWQGFGEDLEVIVERLIRAGK